MGKLFAHLPTNFALKIRTLCATKEEISQQAIRFLLT